MRRSVNKPSFTIMHSKVKILASNQTWQTEWKTATLAKVQLFE